MSHGTVEAIYISEKAGKPMIHLDEVTALKGLGLKGDRYCSGEGSFNRKSPGKRQVTLMNALFFEESGFEFSQSRRNIFTKDVELMYLIGREFKIGDALFRGVKYCDPCQRPNKLLRIKKSFKETFLDRGGLVAEILEGGVIRTGDVVVPPAKSY